VEGALKRAAALGVLFLLTAAGGCRDVAQYEDVPSGGTVPPISWERTSGPSGEAILSLRADQAGVLYAGTESGKLYRTVTDGGVWNLVPLPTSGGAITAIIVDPVRRIFVANDVHGIYASVDGGSSWVSFNAGLQDTSVYSLAYLPGGSLAAGSDLGHVSVVDPASPAWIRRFTFARPVVSILPLSTDVFFASVWGSGVYRFTAGDSVPASVNAGLPDLYVNVLHAGAGGFLFSGTRTTGVARSDPEQVYWQDAGGGSISRDVASLRTSVYGELFAGTGTGVYLSLDSGLHWTKLDAGIGSREVRALAINENARVFAGTADGVYRSIRRN
jgi:ligand-binding sensor domain-containing protein